MSSRIFGTYVQGMSYSGRKDFASIPGLNLWVDPRVNLVVYPTLPTTVRTLQERSKNNFVFSQSSSGSTVKKVTSDSFIQLGIDTLADLDLQNNGLANNLKFLSDGSPFSIYYIAFVPTNAGATSNRFTILGNAGTQRLELTHQLSSGARTVILRIRDSAGSANLMSFNTPHPSYAYDVYNLFEINHRGYGATGNDVDIYVNDVLAGSGNWTSAPDSADLNLPLSLGGGAHLGQPRIVMCVVYNHTGKTESQINVERAEIRQVIEDLYSTLI